MKRFLKSSLSIFLAITMIFSSAIVGLNEIDFSGIFEVNPFKDLVVKPAAINGSVSTVASNDDSYYVTGTLEKYVISVILDGSGVNWISDITVDGTEYAVTEGLINLTQAQEAENKNVIISVSDGLVVSFCTLDSLDTITSVTLHDTLSLTYKNGKFPDKKINVTGNIINKSNQSIDTELIGSQSHLELTDISITLTSSNKDILYFKNGLFKKDTITFEFNEVITAGNWRSFSQKAYINTSYKFPRDIKSDNLTISCTINAKKNNNPITFSHEITVPITNKDFGIKGTWKNQSLDDLLDQIESHVNACPVLTDGEKVEVTASISAVQISSNLLAIKDDLDMLETIYDMGCYFYGLEYATVGTAGAAFLDVIIDECETASDELKSELRTSMQSLTESPAFNKFIYWYYNGQQVVLRNKKQINAHCPIDITVTDEDGNTVLSIVNDTVVTSTEGAAGFVCDSQKTLYLPTDIDHNIKITATADGTMDYSVIEYTSSGSERVVSYSDIELTNGEVYSGSIVRTDSPSADKYNLSTGSGGSVESDECKDFEYAVNSDGTTASITDYTGSQSSVIIPSSINGYTVTRIGDRAFYDCTNLTAITIPNGVTSIGYGAFHNCTNFSAVYITDITKWCEINFELTDSNPLYYAKNLYLNGKLVTDLVIPNNVTNIGRDAFRNCTSLSSVTIPNSVTSIGSGAFSGCTNVKAVYITDITKWCGLGFATATTNPLYYAENLYLNGMLVTDLVIPNNVTTISGNAFYNCRSLISVTIPNSVKSIGSNAFTFCANLSSITIPNSVTSIGVGAFEDCYNITSIVIPDSVTSIGSYAFFNCLSLTSVKLSNNITSIGDYAFESCDSLTSIVLPDSVMNIGVSAFRYCDSLTSVKLSNNITNIGDCAFESCYSLTSITIPNSVTSIGDFAFRYCDSLTSIAIPEGVTTIGKLAFYNCYKLEMITVDSNNTAYASDDGVLFTKDKTVLICYPAGKTTASYIISDDVTCIEEKAFFGCNRLKSVTIGSGIKSIGNHSFCYCWGIESIVLPNSVKIIGENAFFDCSNLNYVFYSGSEIEWSGISIGASNEDLTGSAVHFNLTGHSYDEGVVQSQSTCITDGETLYTCTCVGCGHSYTETILALGHTESKWIMDKKATVNAVGKKHKECTECGEVLDTEAIPQLKCAKPVLKKVYNANSYVKVTWGTVKGADLYRVYRKTGTGSYEYIGSTKNTYFNDKEAGAGKTCRYRIRAKNEAGYSEYSVSIAIKHIDEPTLKSIENSAYGVLIKWNKVTGAQKYNVYRKVSGGEYEYIGATTNAYYTDKTAKSGTKYYYAIRGKRDDSVSSQSASLSKLYLADPTLNTPSSTTKGVGLRWSKVTGAEGYMVYRRTASGSYKRITTEKGVDNLTYRDTTAKKGTKYYYKVKAYYSKTYSAYSNTKTITDKY